MRLRSAPIILSLLLAGVFSAPAWGNSVTPIESGTVLFSDPAVPINANVEYAVFKGSDLSSSVQQGLLPATTVHGDNYDPPKTPAELSAFWSTNYIYAYQIHVTSNSDSISSLHVSFLNDPNSPLITGIGYYSGTAGQAPDFYYVTSDAAEFDFLEPRLLADSAILWFSSPSPPGLESSGFPSILSDGGEATNELAMPLQPGVSFDGSLPNQPNGVTDALAVPLPAAVWPAGAVLGLAWAGWVLRSHRRKSV